MLTKRYLLTFKKKKLSKQIRRTRINSNTNYGSLVKNYNIVVPKFWLCFFLLNQDKNLYKVKIYSLNYYYSSSFNSLNTFLYFNKDLNILSFTHKKSSLLQLRWLIELNFMVSLFIYFYSLKVKFKGKGYYIYKNTRNTIAPKFGYAHRIYLYSFFNIVKFLTKTKVLIFGLSKEDVLKVSYSIKSKRPVNIFTGRGVRFSRELIYKKTGKVSSYR